MAYGQGCAVRLAKRSRGFPGRISLFTDGLDAVLVVGFGLIVHKRQQKTHALARPPARLRLRSVVQLLSTARGRPALLFRALCYKKHFYIRLSCHLKRK